ncbi:SH3 and multiple ankyrin repeat domains protein 2 [Myxocyprinus asiaticus]|uniref:SH3 and multiple ankyrin repeat domains protein 2 n=1 Tax=Myxocyprinus asiaticus TaxID=70543 RepID=UPI002223CAE3|nr:SH3 and multiple ankyrin repeat domains protein 2 [Myxocyprinus asiaticus]
MIALMHPVSLTADKPIEVFTPTSAFPALQYLESVDEGGVAWQAGLRTGDFLIEVNHENVVKVGHRQVVNMIRQGGNCLVIKVVTVSRSVDPDYKARKKAPPPPKRAPTTALSTRTKSMALEMEQLDKVGETVQSQKPRHDKATVDKVPSIKPSPTKSVDFNTMEKQGVTVVPHTVPGRSHGSYIGVPKGTMRRQKPIGNAEDEKTFLIPPLPKFTRSLSMPDISEDIPPPPGISPPSPPNNISALIKQRYEPNHSIYTQTSTGKGHTLYREQLGYHRQNSEQYDFQNASVMQQNMCAHNKASVPENPYSEVGTKPLYVPAKPARRKGVLVKQPNVEDSPEKTCSILIPTIIVKEPSTSSSGKSSQGSSIEIETTTSDQPAQLCPEDSLVVSNLFSAAIAGAVRDREKRLKVCRNSPALLSMDLGDKDSSVPTPHLRQTMSIDEGMIGNDKSLQKVLSPPTTVLGVQQSGGGGNTTDFNISELRNEPLITHTESCHNVTGPISLPASKTYSLNDRGFSKHPVTGKMQDNLALGPAASDRAMNEQVQPPLPPAHKADLNQPLFIDTKLRSSIEANFAAAATVDQQNECGGLFRQPTESNHDTEKANKCSHPEQMKNIRNTMQQKSAGLLMFHTVDKTKANLNSQSDGLKQAESLTLDRENAKLPAPNSEPPPLSHSRNVTFSTSVEEPVKFPFCIPPPPLTLLDIEEELDLAEPLPPPLEFANSIDIPEDHLAEILNQKKNSITGGPLPLYHSNASMSGVAESKCLSGLINCMLSHSYLPPPPERFELVTDLSIEEVDSRSSGDPHFEATSTISTVSSISALSSEVTEALDTCVVYTNKQTLSVARPPVPQKPKKSIINKSNALYRDTLIKESIESFRQLPPAPPPPLGCVPQPEPHKTLAHRDSKLWEEPHELQNPLSNPHRKADVISELSSKLQQMNKDRFPKQEGSFDSGSRSTGSSTLAKHQLEEKQKLLSLLHHKLKTDVITRWNSAYEMLERFLEQQPAICAALLSPVLIQDMKDNTEETSVIREIKRVINEDLSKMYTTEQETSLLHKEEREEMYRRVIAEASSSQEQVDGAKVYENPDDSTVKEANSPQPEITGKQDQCPSVSKWRASSLLQSLLGQTFSDASVPLHHQSVYARPEEEMAKYRSTPPFSLSEDPLNWWHANKVTFPLLSKLAKRECAAQSSGTKCSTTMTSCAVPSTPVSCLPTQNSSPASSPAESGPASGCSSSLPASATTPTLTDVFSLLTSPTVKAEQCYSLSSFSSGSLSPLTQFQAAVEKPFTGKPVLLWTKHDVADWLESLNLAEHRKAFLDNEIEGTHLPNLLKEDLVDLGVARVGHRMNIERALKHLMDR